MPAAIRPLVSADLDRVVAIEREAFTDPWPRSAFLDLLAQPQVRGVAADASAPSAARGLDGYALALVAADEAEILNLAVAPDARRRGIGRALLDELLAVFRREQVARVHLEVRQSNAGALRLYQAAGFRPVSTRRAYYRNPTENAVTMTLRLNAESAQK